MQTGRLRLNWTPLLRDWARRSRLGLHMLHSNHTLSLYPMENSNSCIPVDLIDVSDMHWSYWEGSVERRNPRPVPRGVKLSSHCVMSWKPGAILWVLTLGHYTVSKKASENLMFQCVVKTWCYIVSRIVVKTWCTICCENLMLYYE